MNEICRKKPLLPQWHIDRRDADGGSSQGSKRDCLLASRLCTGCVDPSRSNVICSTGFRCSKTSGNCKPVCCRKTSHCRESICCCKTSCNCKPVHCGQTSCDCKPIRCGEARAGADHRVDSRSGNGCSSRSNSGTCSGHWGRRSDSNPCPEGLRARTTNS